MDPVIGDQFGVAIRGVDGVTAALGRDLRVTPVDEEVHATGDGGDTGFIDTHRHTTYQALVPGLLPTCSLSMSQEMSHGRRNASLICAFVYV
jgi:N-acyl-D-aspartate/D-glutamate deacylase